MSDLPERPPDGHTRYKAHTQKAGNPFRGAGPAKYSQTVDIPDTVPLEQVEEWARESAENSGLTFLRLEEVK